MSAKHLPGFPLKLYPIVCNHMMRHPISANDVMRYEFSHLLGRHVAERFCFYPFREIVNSDHNESMAIRCLWLDFPYQINSLS